MSKEQSCFVLADMEKCSGCRACEVACFAVHLKNPLKTVGAVTTPVIPNLYVTKSERGTMPIQCHHCENAPCLLSCATRAITRENDVVVINRRKCIGCKNCVVACPFGAIGLLGAAEIAEIGKLYGCCGVPKDGTAVKYVYKCDLCAGRDKPACVSVCPNEALRVVDASDELSDKRSRAADAMETVAALGKQEGRV